MGYPRGRESGEIGNNFFKIAQLFTIEKAHRGRQHSGGRDWEYKVREAGNSDPPVPPPPKKNSRGCTPFPVSN